MEPDAIKDLLPIGSVVILNKGSKPLMIYGVRQADAKASEREYDYLGVLYPEGYFGEQMKFLFDRENIEEVLFRGYETPEREVFLQKLADFYEKKQAK